MRTHRKNEFSKILVKFSDIFQASVKRKFLILVTIFNRFRLLYSEFCVSNVESSKALTFCFSAKMYHAASKFPTF